MYGAIKYKSIRIQIINDATQENQFNSVLISMNFRKKYHQFMDVFRLVADQYTNRNIHSKITVLVTAK